jgi:hypothetical protein
MNGIRALLQIKRELRKKYMFDKLRNRNHPTHSLTHSLTVRKRNSGVSLSGSFTIGPGKTSFADSHSNAAENNEV